MRKVRRPIVWKVMLLSLVAVALLAVIVARLFFRPPPAASDAEPPTATTAAMSCDDLAAHPEDEHKGGPGVADDDILPERAIQACTRELEHSPATGRLYFQLGRAYWVDQESDDAIAAFLKAEELGYAPAYYYLGLAFEQGLVPGEPADPGIARELFLLGAAEGFPPAIRASEGTR